MLGPFPLPFRCLCRERAESPTNISFAQTLERPVAELANTLARDAKQRTDFLERVLASALETEIQSENFRVARRQRGERRLDLVVEEAIHRLFLGVGHLVGDETLDQRAIAFRIHRRIETDVAGVERGERLNDINRKTGEVRQLFRSWLSPHLLTQNLRRLDDAREISGAIQRNAHGAALTRQRRQNRLTNPPHRVRDELDALIRIELTSSSEQTDVAFTDQIDERHAAVLIFLRHRDDETQIALDELLECVGIAGANPTSNLDLLCTFEQRIRAHLVQVLIENVSLGFVRSYSGDGRFAATLDFSHLCHTSGTTVKAFRMRSHTGQQCERVNVFRQPGNASAIASRSDRNFQVVKTLQDTGR